jgi:hypothetical protein
VISFSKSLSVRVVLGTSEHTHEMYLYTMKFYSVTKKNEILSFAGKRIKLENIILSEVSQAQKVKSHMFSLIRGIQT